MNYIDLFNGLNLVRCVCVCACVCVCVCVSVVRWSIVYRKWLSSYVMQRLVSTHTEKEIMCVVCCIASNSIMYLDHTALQVLLSCPSNVQGNSLSVSIPQKRFVEKPVLAESV
jgi:hypothetical protein